MLYAFPPLIALMLAYMFWLTAYRLRRDRVATARVQRRRFRSGHRRGPLAGT